MSEIEANASDPMNFSGSASDLMSAMKAAGIQAPEAEAAALKVAEAPASAPEACKDPECTHDHSHAGHDHSHGHGHGHDDGHNHGHGHGHGHKDGGHNEGSSCSGGADGAACTDTSHGHDGHGHAHGHAHTDSDDEEIVDSNNIHDDGTPAENALRDNIARKGRNAYYYAHARTSDAPKWDGSEAPRLLEKKVSGEGGATDGGVGSSPPEVVKKLAKFAWGDEKDKVKVYVSFKDNGLAPVVEGQDNGGGANPGIEHALTFTETSVSLRLTPPAANGAGGRTVVHQLDLAPLYEPIAKATARVRADKVIITLHKKPDACFTWYDIKKSK